MIERIGGAGAPRAQAGQQSDKLREAAEEFEALFVEMMLKQARAANRAWNADEKKDMGRDTYEGWQDREMAVAIVRGGGLGVAEMLYRQLQREQMEGPVRR